MAAATPKWFGFLKPDTTSVMYFLLGMVFSVAFLHSMELAFVSPSQNACTGGASGASNCPCGPVDGGAVEPYIHALPLNSMFATSSNPRDDLTGVYLDPTDGVESGDIVDDPEAYVPIRRLHRVPRTIVDDACRPYAKYLLFNSRYGQLNNQLVMFRNALMLGHAFQMVVVLPDIDNDSHRFRKLTPFEYYYDVEKVRKTFNAITLTEFHKTVLPKLSVNSVELFEMMSAGVGQELSPARRQMINNYLVKREGYDANNTVRYLPSSTQVFEEELGIKISGFTILRFRTLAQYALKRPCAFNTLSRVIGFHRPFVGFPKHWYEMLCDKLFFCDVESTLTRHIRPRAEYMRIVDKLQEELPGKQLSVHVRTMEYEQCVRLFLRAYPNDPRHKNETVVLNYCHPPGDMVVTMLHRRGVLRDVDSVFFAHDGRSAEWLNQMQAALLRYRKSTNSLLEAAAPESDRIVFRASPSQEEVESIWNKVNSAEADMPMMKSGRYMLPIIDFELAARGKWILGNIVSSATKMTIQIAEDVYSHGRTQSLFYHMANSIHTSDKASG